MDYRSRVLLGRWSYHEKCALDCRNGSHRAEQTGSAAEVPTYAVSDSLITPDQASVVGSAQVHRTVSYPDAHAASNARLSASDRILTPRSRVTGQLAKRPTERNDIESVTSQPGDPIIMPSYSPELIRTMRAALEQAMTKIPADQATPGIKAHMAEVILKAAAGGQTSYEGLVASASDQIQPILSMLT